MSTSVDGSATPAGPRNSRASTALYTAAFAPVPKARLRTITAVRPGLRPRARNASRRSCDTLRLAYSHRLKGQPKTRRTGGIWFLNQVSPDLLFCCDQLPPLFELDRQHRERLRVSNRRDCVAGDARDR